MDNAKQLLLTLLKDETEAESYYQATLAAKGVRPLIDTVIKPLISCHRLPPDEATHERFYLPLAEASQASTGVKITKSNLYRQIREYVRAYSRQCNTNHVRYETGRYSDGMDISIERTSTGETYCSLHLQFRTRDPWLADLLIEVAEAMHGHFGREG